MKREFHVRFWEGGGVRFPSATRPGPGQSTRTIDRPDVVASSASVKTNHFAGETSRRAKCWPSTL